MRKIVFLANVNLKHVELIKKLILEKLFYFKNSFSKKRFIHIILLKLRQDVILKLISNFLMFKQLKNKTFIKYILFKTKHVKNYSHKSL